MDPALILDQGIISTQDKKNGRGAGRRKKEREKGKGGGGKKQKMGPRDSIEDFGCMDRDY